MGGTQSVEFGVALEQASYFPGETINGYVQVRVLADNIKVPELCVSFTGTAFTQVYHKRSKESSAKLLKQNEVFLNIVAKVGSIDQGRLVRGAQLQCPFAFTIPNYVVASMPEIVDGRARAEIKYQVSIYSTKPGKVFGSNTTCVHSVAVDMLASPPLLMPPSRIEDFVEVRRCYCFPVGTIRLAATSSVSAYQSGSEMIVSYDVDNQCNHDISYINISIDRHITFSARGKRHTWNKTILTTKMPGVDRGDSFGSNTSQASPMVDGKASVDVQRDSHSVSLQVPELAYYTTMFNTIGVSYFLTVYAKNKNEYVRDLVASIPVKFYRLGPAAIGKKVRDLKSTDDDSHDDVMIATVVGIEYEPNPKNIVNAIESPIVKATLVR